jgi:hypothetical protein
MRMRTAVLFLFAAVLAAPAAAQETRTWHSDSGYAVDLPDSWIRVADRHIDNIRRNVSPENAVGTQSVEMAFETGAARDAEVGAGLLRAEMQTAVSGPLFTWTALALHPSGRSMTTIVYYGPLGDDERPAVAQLRSIFHTLRED